MVDALQHPDPARLAASTHPSGGGAAAAHTADDAEVAALRSMVEGTAGSFGEAFFQSLVRHLAAALGVKYAFVAEFMGGTRARTLAYWYQTEIVENFEWDLVGTPCEDVVFGNLCHHPAGVAGKFPKDEPLTRMGIEGYLGVPLHDPGGAVLGHLAVFHDRALPPEPRQLFVFRIFAARAAAELQRLKVEKQLRESEDRYRDLFDEAPIAYVHEDLQSRFLSANRAAMRILGITPEQVPTTVGMSFIPDTPDAQRRVREAFASIGKGTDTSGVILELRRKDNGKPIWIQWWSKPDPAGQYTRTMFVDITDRVLMEREKSRLQAQNLYLQEEIRSAHNFGEIVGRSPAIAAVLELVGRVAPTDASVLITGETGTGKELIARAIHSNSTRKDKPLIKVNCAALPAGLVESELFGHERGAFSGAIAKRVGRFELADGGTLFLDEVGEIPLDVQAKLLRVLQERAFERVGGAAEIAVNVRVIAATNRDLLKRVREGQFREDLYYRLNVFPVALPPLRSRVDDIGLLADFLVQKFAARVGKRIVGVTLPTRERLATYSWPGNVRELENVIERAVILATGDLLDIDPATFTATAANGTQAPAPATDLASIERNHVLSVLRQTNWVIDGMNGAARILGLHPNTLRSRLKKMGITKSSAPAS